MSLTSCTRPQRRSGYHCARRTGVVHARENGAPVHSNVVARPIIKVTHVNEQVTQNWSFMHVCAAKMSVSNYASL